MRNLSAQQPAQQFQFDPTLRDAMARETELFFQSQVREDRPIQDLLRANYTFLNDRLAQHYGISGVFGSQFRRVTLTNEDRFGLLGQASVLTVTSYNDRTSVVRRGYWMLDVLLGAPPPPPPPNVPPLKENDPREKPAALRERMEQHRNNAVCASCHAQMDPLGFALEHFDAVGQVPGDRWRRAASIQTIVFGGSTVEQPEGVPRGAARPGRRGRADGDREAAHLRARPRTHLPRRACRSRSSFAIAARERLPLVVA